MAYFRSIERTIGDPTCHAFTSTRPQPTRPYVHTSAAHASVRTRVARPLLYTAIMSRPTKLSAGVVVVRDTPEGWRYLLLRAFTHWDFPKGMVEPGEDPLSAAVREVKEETLIEDLDFAWGHDYIETG